MAAPATDAPPITAPPAAQGSAVRRFRGGAALLFLGGRTLFRASYFDWTTTISADVDPPPTPGGADDDDLTMDFSFVPRIAFVRSQDHWAWVGTQIGWTASLMSRERGSNAPELLLADIPIQAGYAYTIVENDAGLAILAGPRAGVALPTSAASRAAGIHALTRVALDADANVPLLRGDWLNGVFLSASAGWQHLFSAGTTAGSYDVGDRSYLSGRNFRSEPLSTEFFVRDRISMGASFWLNLWGDLSLGNSFGLGFPFRDEPPEAACVSTATDPCVVVEPTRPTGPSSYTTAFDVSLSYPVAELVWIALGYNNTASSLGEDGKRRSMFYSRGAQLYLSATLLLDRLYGRATQPGHADRVPSF